MIHIIVGKINQGKTEKMIEIYQTLQKGDGFVSVKKFNKNTCIGYDIMQLSTGETYPFIRGKKALPAHWTTLLTLGSFSFSQQTFNLIYATMHTMLDQHISPLFLDEIGRLELQGQCFDTLLRLILERRGEVYITTRDIFLNQVIKKYNINKKSMIFLTKEYA